MMSVFEQPPEVAAGDWGYYVLPGKKDQQRRLYDVREDYSIHHVSFHIHEHGRRLLLRNTTTGRVIADARPSYAEGRSSASRRSRTPRACA